MWEFLLKVAGFFGVGRPDAVDGFDRLTRAQEKRLTHIEKRLDDCDEDRTALRTELSEVKSEVRQCHEDRDELRSRVETLESKAS